MIKVRAKLKKTGVEYNVDIVKSSRSGFLNPITISVYDMDGNLVNITYGEPIYYKYLFTPVYANIKSLTQLLDYWDIKSFDLEHFNSLSDVTKDKYNLLLSKIRDIVRDCRLTELGI